MEGRTRTISERRWHDTVADVCGCICCILDGRRRNYEEQAHVSIHHCDGRTKQHAHWYVLPLCAGHHMPGTGPVGSMTAVHGDKAAFIAEYSREIVLVEACVRMVEAAQREVPAEVRALLAKWHASQQYQEHENVGPDGSKKQ